MKLNKRSKIKGFMLIEFFLVIGIIISLLLFSMKVIMPSIEKKAILLEYYSSQNMENLTEDDYKSFKYFSKKDTIKSKYSQHLDYLKKQTTNNEIKAE